MAAAAAYRVEVTILGLWIFLQKPALAASCQRGMVVKAAGCAGQGILILAWLETRDHSIRSRCGPRRTSLLTLTGPPEEP